LADKAELIKRYKQTGSKQHRNEAVMEYMNVVRFHVYSLRNMYEGFIDAEDVTNEAVLGLMNAIENFDTEKGVKFETYASIVVRGAIVDFIRKSDPMPHRLNKFGKDAGAIFSKLYADLGREPTEPELAKALGISPKNLNKYLARIASYQAISLDELLGENFDVREENNDDGVWQAEEELFKKEKISMLAKAIESLKEKERLCITLYYYEKMTLSAIGKTLGLTEARACQLHSSAIVKLKDYMQSYNRGE
jgi:RNA polymerase sigma factor for flagellar operon FliA